VSAPSSWPWPHLWPTRAVAVTVIAVTVLFAGLDVLGAVLGARTTGAAGPWAGLVLQLAVDLCLLAVVRAPLGVALVVLAGTVAVLVAPEMLHPVPETVSGGTVLGPTGAVVFVLVQLRNRRSTWLLVGALTLLAVRPWDPSWTTVPLGLLNTLVPALAGRYVDARRRLIESLRERAERTDREQLLLAEQARAEERERLAAEMHDIVSHRVSLMVLQAGALEVTAADADTRQAATALRSAGIQALDELRELVGVLHTPPEPDGTPLSASPPLGPMPAVPDVAELAAASRAAGVTVELAVSGDAALAPPAVARTVHRVVQEGLTNVHKHARGGSVCVEIRYADDAVTVAVRNTAPTDGPDPQLAPRGSGSGLRGLRERVEIIGGTLDAALRPDGGFEVHARLPTGGR
jgi:signal transduction histidine kinase